MTIRVLKLVFRNGRYVLGALGVIVGTLTTVLLLPNYAVITQVFSAEMVGFFTKVSFLFSLYGTLFSNYAPLTAVLLLITMILYGMQVGLLVYYIRRRRTGSVRQAISWTGIGGFVSVFLGLGCAACGTAVLTALLGLSAAGGLLVLLPLGGVEFVILGMLLLAISIVYLAKKINDPLTCAIE